MRNLYESPEEKAYKNAYEEAYEKAYKKAYVKTKLYCIINVMDSLEMTAEQAMDVLKISDNDKSECKELVEKIKQLLHVEYKKMKSTLFSVEEESWIDDLIRMVPNADSLCTNEEYEKIREKQY